MFSTMMKTDHDLLLNTVFFIMAISVLAGAVGALLIEFGVIAQEPAGQSYIKAAVIGNIGAAIGLVPKFISQGLIGPNEIAVFTAMGMCWSGYLSTHVAMMDLLESRELTNRAILSHAVGGLCAGIVANLMFKLLV